MYIDLNNSRTKELTRTLRMKKGREQEIKKAIASRNPEEIWKAWYNYKIAQNKCIQIIDKHKAKAVESRLIQIPKSCQAKANLF